MHGGANKTLQSSCIHIQERRTAPGDRDVNILFAEHMYNLIGIFVFNAEGDNATLGDAPVTYNNTGEWTQLCAQLIS